MMLIVHVLTIYVNNTISQRWNVERIWKVSSKLYISPVNPSRGLSLKQFDLGLQFFQHEEVLQPVYPYLLSCLYGISLFA